ncbi:unnamed protein product [Didymodactylos carnosus]|uniref:Uncharacterized protein n=1 Tax=Didymodactylos carnosus TaxID=1234261 RepID=A0A815VMR5_9BILA|nr:unnamed protein product [Didymodactylos carnosus]CAF1537213.1 unnamed protein product [Didymodactylos carnosus]CAF3909454.1 unnamed protein product [Didymodactylos carnosus]CAF4397156.1 unnamed protein product [Didymodactylos carnosus]
MCQEIENDKLKIFNDILEPFATYTDYFEDSHLPGLDGFGIDLASVDILPSGSLYDGMCTRIPQSYFEVKTQCNELIKDRDFDLMLVVKDMIIQDLDNIRNISIRSISSQVGLIFFYFSNSNYGKIYDYSNNEFLCSDEFVNQCTTKYIDPNAMTHVVSHKKSGPAINVTIIGNLSYVYSTDLVFALHCPVWPSIVSSWKTRVQCHGWLNDEVVEDIIQTNGFHVVPVGRKSSANKNNEWRISFSNVEKRLARLLKPHQKQCYGLLRSLLKIINSAEAITNNISKALFFRFCENNTETASSTASHFLKLIAFVIDSLSSKYIEHYFIDKCNLLDGISDHIIDNVVIILTKFHQNPIQFFADKNSDILFSPYLLASIEKLSHLYVYGDRQKFTFYRDMNQIISYINHCSETTDGADVVSALNVKFFRTTFTMVNTCTDEKVLDSIIDHMRYLADSIGWSLTTSEKEEIAHQWALCITVIVDHE